MNAVSGESHCKLVSCAKKLPTVSVIITTRHRPTLLRRAIDSVLRQTVRNLELIVVVDGPDPETSSALDEVTDSRIRIHTNDTNLGVSESRNSGVKLCLSSLVAFLDDDDFWREDKLEIQLNYLGSRDVTDQVLVVCRYAINDFTGDVYPKRFPKDGEIFSEYLFVHRQLWMPSTYLASKRLLEEKPFKAGLHSAEDMDWLLRVLQQKSVTWIACPDVLVAYDCTPRPKRLSLVCPWRDLLNWAAANRPALTPRSFSAFLLRHCVPVARGGQTPKKTILKVIWIAIVKGKPAANDILYAIAVATAPDIARTWISKLKRKRQ